MVAESEHDNSSGLVAFWLLPADVHKGYLVARIHRLADEHDAPVFDPHVTLYLTGLHPDESPAVVLEKLSEAFPPVECVAGLTMHSSELFKALFVPVSGSALHALHYATRALCGDRASGFDFAPHVSLMYKILPDSERAALATGENLSGQRIVCDEVAAICPAPGAPDFSDIAGWRKVAGRKLSG